MDPRTVEKLECKIEEAIAEIIVKMGLRKLPLLPSRQRFIEAGIEWLGLTSPLQVLSQLPGLEDRLDSTGKGRDLRSELGVGFSSLKEVQELRPAGSARKTAGPTFGTTTRASWGAS